MVDQNIIIGAGVAFAGLAVGAGMVAFTEAQGERTAERGAISSDVSASMLAVVAVGGSGGAGGFSLCRCDASEADLLRRVVFYLSDVQTVFLKREVLGGALRHS